MISCSRHLLIVLQVHVCMQEYEGRFRFKGSWKATYLSASIEGYEAARTPQLRVQGMYSDLLYQPHVCATTPILPEWLAVSNVDRKAGLSVEQFRQQYEEPNIPVILTDQASKLPTHAET